MSHKTRLAKLERNGSGNRLWAFIGIGRPRDTQHQLLLESQAREAYYASGGDRSAYIAYLPYECFDKGFIGYVTRNEFDALIMNETKNPAESSRDSQCYGTST